MVRDDDTQAWVVEIEDLDPAREPARAAILTLGDGIVGTRADLPGGTEGAGVVAAGIYQGVGPETVLAPLPSWNQAPLEEAIPRRRVLDLRDGTLRTELDTPGGEASTVTFASLARPGTAVLVAEGPEFQDDQTGPLRLPVAAEHGREDVRWWARVHGSGGVAVAASERVVRMAAARLRLERLVAYATDPREAPRPEAAVEALEAAEQLGVETLLAEQRSAWARRWSAADIQIEGDPELQRAVRFCLFHLMASVADRAEAALGARGLSGPGYRGHVFWDTDVFVLPFLASTHPPAARALVGYRVQRLDAARAAAARGGFEGARFPWESADSGDDVTPAWITDSSGELIRVLNGEQEEHITADVAWAVARYQAWSGDAQTLGACRELLCETARYWASRVRLDTGGAAHIDGVIGPDEYHENVNDNAFTNAMVRWNLLHAAALGASHAEEAGHWRRCAAALVDGYDLTSLRHEQFAGYFDLEPLTVADLPHGADPVELLGREQVQRTQLVKQADVLMLHLLIPELVSARSLGPDIAWYEPRTTHASSLSAPVHAAVLARAGRLDDALAYLRKSATIDLDDRTGNTREGLHFAAMGGVWHALVHGVAGLELQGLNLKLHPHLPPGWEALEFQVMLHGVGFRFRVLPDRVVVRARKARSVRVGISEDWVAVGADGVVVEHDALGWRSAP
jgi:trehalose/maltose hydrolase-like predicted phosphorylase